MATSTKLLAQLGELTLTLALVLGAASCTSAEQGQTTEAPAPCVAGEARQPVRGCEAGIPAERCAAGFASDGEMGCTPVLPEAACPEGELALPGEAACHAVGDCGSGSYGLIPVDATTEYVDATYAGGDSDGSAAKPWTTITAAVTAAAPGALIAIAAGDYAEDLALTEPVRLWGRCPAMVTVVGSATPLAAVTVSAGANGTELHGLAIRGAMGGVRIQGSTEVVLEQLWVHDTGNRGVTLQSDEGAVSATLRSSLIERASILGIQVVGSSLELESSSVRDTEELGPASEGQGLVVQPHTTNSNPASATIRTSLFERNHTANVLALGSTLSLEASVVRNTLPSQLSQRDGIGVLVQASDTVRSQLSITGCLVSDNYTRGIAIVGSDGTIEATEVRDVLPQDWDQDLGEGIGILNQLSLRSDVTVSESKIWRSHQSGIAVRGSDLTLDGSLVRDIEPGGANDNWGRGLAVLRESDHALEASAEVLDSRIENAFTYGIWVADATLTMSSSLVAQTKPQLSNAGLGDGLALGTLEPELPSKASAVVTGSRFDDNARAGIGLLGASLRLEQSTLECNSYGVHATRNYQNPTSDYGYENAGGNECGCGTTRMPCDVEEY